MTAIKSMLTSLVLLIIASPAMAEYRAVLLRITQDKDRKPSVSIYSDVKTDRKTAVAMDDAIKAIGQIKGWRSGVGVYVVADKGFSQAERNRLFAAIDANTWLDLEYFGREAPERQREQFLKEEVPAK